MAGGQREETKARMVRALAGSSQDCVKEVGGLRERPSLKAGRRSDRNPECDLAWETCSRAHKTLSPSLEHCVYGTTRSFQVFEILKMGPSLNGREAQFPPKSGFARIFYHSAQPPQGTGVLILASAKW